MFFASHSEILILNSNKKWVLKKNFSRICSKKNKTKQNKLKTDGMKCNNKDKEMIAKYNTGHFGITKPLTIENILKKI